jgi:glycosyltransferase involved in cell wall biosynthesis
MKLSICIPTYDRSLSLSFLINTIIKQTKSLSVEIIVCDNSENLLTQEVCKNFIKYKNFHYHKNDQNIGFAKNVKNCIERSSGDYIWLIGDDDLLSADAVNVVYNKIVNSNCGWICFNFTKLLGKHKFRRNYLFQNFETNSLDLFLNKMGIWSSFMSITIVHSDVKKVLNKFSYNNYYLFSLALHIGSQYGCNFINNTILSRDCSNITSHRFDNLNTYLFDFFETINYLVNKNILSSKTKIKLANSLFVGIVPFLLIKHRIDKKLIPDIRLVFNNYNNCINFWFFFVPLYFIPKRIIILLYNNINLIKSIRNIY